MFQGLGTLEEEHHIRLKPSSKPFSLSVSRKNPTLLLDVFKRDLDDMEREGVIGKIETPTHWCSGHAEVPKSSGGYRLGVDLTKLNQVTQRERYISPTLDQILGHPGKARVFSKLDVTFSFHRGKLSKESDDLTTFITFSAATAITVFLSTLHPYRRFSNARWQGFWKAGEPT